MLREISRWLIAEGRQHRAGEQPAGEGRIVPLLLRWCQAGGRDRQGRRMRDRFIGTSPGSLERDIERLRRRYGTRLDVSLSFAQPSDGLCIVAIPAAGAYRLIPCLGKRVVWIGNPVLANADPGIPAPSEKMGQTLFGLVSLKGIAADSSGNGRESGRDSGTARIVCRRLAGLGQGSILAQNWQAGVPLIVSGEASHIVDPGTAGYRPGATQWDEKRFKERDAVSEPDEVTRVADLRQIWREAGAAAALMRQIIGDSFSRGITPFDMAAALIEGDAECWLVQFSGFYGAGGGEAREDAVRMLLMLGYGRGDIHQLLGGDIRQLPDAGITDDIIRLVSRDRMLASHLDSLVRRFSKQIEDITAMREVDQASSRLAARLGLSAHHPQRAARRPT